MKISAKFQLYPHTDSEELICVYFPQIEPFSCHDNQSNWEVWIKSICLVEDHSTNISKKNFAKISATK